jgi:hypothetical protein
VNQHSPPPSSNTQRAAILRLLIDARGGWVPLPKIIACAAQYNARIFELRRTGFEIENKTEDIDGVKHSWFRLLREAAPRQDQTSRQVGDLPRLPDSDYDQRTRELRDRAVPLFAGVKL